MPVDDNWSAFSIVYMHAGETSVAHYINHTQLSVTRMRHERETRTNVATLGLPPVGDVLSRRSYGCAK